MYTKIERAILARLGSLFGRGQVESVEAKGGGCWVAHIRGGRLVQGCLDEEGTLCFEDLEAVC